MPIGTKLIGDRIKDTQTNEPKQEDWTQMSLQSQAPKITPSSSLQVIIVVYKHSTNPLPQSIE